MQRCTGCTTYVSAGTAAGTAAGLLTMATLTMATPTMAMLCTAAFTMATPTMRYLLWQVGALERAAVRRFGLRLEVPGQKAAEASSSLRYT